MENLKRIVLAGLIILTGCGSVPAKEESAALAVPVSLADVYTWDFGKVSAGQVAQHEFILKNETQKALKIGQINSSCGCTASAAKKNTLAPGESTAIEVKFNSKGYSGAVQQYIYVNTDNPQNPIIKFTIKADVQK